MGCTHSNELTLENTKERENFVLNEYNIRVSLETDFITEYTQACETSQTICFQPHEIVFRVPILKSDEFAVFDQLVTDCLNNGKFNTIAGRFSEIFKTFHLICKRHCEHPDMFIDHKFLNTYTRLFLIFPDSRNILLKSRHNHILATTVDGVDMLFINNYKSVLLTSKIGIRHLVINKEYSVLYNGSEYECLCETNEGIEYIIKNGNKNILTNYANGIKYLFKNNYFDVLYQNNKFVLLMQSDNGIKYIFDNGDRNMLLNCEIGIKLLIQNKCFDILYNNQKYDKLIGSDDGMKYIFDNGDRKLLLNCKIGFEYLYTNTHWDVLTTSEVAINWLVTRAGDRLVLKSIIENDLYCNLFLKCHTNLCCGISICTVCNFIFSILAKSKHNALLLTTNKTCEWLSKSEYSECLIQSQSAHKYLIDRQNDHNIFVLHKNNLSHHLNITSKIYAIVKLNSCDNIMFNANDIKFLIGLGKSIEFIVRHAEIIDMTRSQNSSIYDEYGYDKYGINRQGNYNCNIHKLTQSKYEIVYKYDSRGFNQFGYDSSGFDVRGFNHLGYDRNGYDTRGYDIHGFDSSRCDKKSCDENGYNKFGRNFDDRNCSYTEIGYNSHGYNVHGVHISTVRSGQIKVVLDKDGRDILDNHFYSNGYDAYGYNREGYDENGYDRFGYDSSGYNCSGYSRYGYNKNGYDKHGLNRSGCAPNGYDSNGYDKNGYDKNGFNRLGYASNGYDKNGYDVNGFNEAYCYDKAYGFNKSGYDKNGFNKNGIDVNGKSNRNIKERFCVDLQIIYNLLISNESIKNTFYTEAIQHESMYDFIQRNNINLLLTKLDGAIYLRNDKNNYDLLMKNNIGREAMLLIPDGVVMIAKSEYVEEYLDNIEIQGILNTFPNRLEWHKKIMYFNFSKFNIKSGEHDITILCPFCRQENNQYSIIACSFCDICTNANVTMMGKFVNCIHHLCVGCICNMANNKHKNTIVNVSDNKDVSEKKKYPSFD